MLKQTHSDDNLIKGSKKSSLEWCDERSMLDCFLKLPSHPLQSQDLTIMSWRTPTRTAFVSGFSTHNILKASFWDAEQQGAKAPLKPDGKSGWSISLCKKNALIKFLPTLPLWTHACVSFNNWKSFSLPPQKQKNIVTPTVHINTATIKNFVRIFFNLVSPII